MIETSMILVVISCPRRASAKMAAVASEDKPASCKAKLHYFLFASILYEYERILARTRPTQPKLTAALVIYYHYRTYSP